MCRKSKLKVTHDFFVPPLNDPRHFNRKGSARFENSIRRTFKGQKSLHRAENIPEI